MLPPEVWMEIILYLDPKALSRLFRTSSNFYQFSQDPILWKTLIEYRFNMHSDEGCPKYQQLHRLSCKAD